MYSPRVVLAAALLAATPLGPAWTAEVSHRTEFEITLAGLPMAKAAFLSIRNDRTYEITADIVSTGLAKMIAKTRATMRSTGNVHDDTLRPDRFAFEYSYGRKSRKFRTRFEGGNVVDSVIEPQPKRRKNWVAIAPEHLRNVSDPIAGLILPGDANPCKATIPVYDGETRLNLHLTDKGRKPFETDGFKGDVVVCSVRYEPIAGYRKNHSDINYVRKLKNMEIWFAKSPAMNVYAPVYLSVPTKYGPLRMQATHFDG